MARRGIQTVKTKYDFDNLSMSDMVGDPRTLSRAELKRRLNNLLNRIPYGSVSIRVKDDSRKYATMTIRYLTRTRMYITSLRRLSANLILTRWMTLGVNVWQQLCLRKYLRTTNTLISNPSQIASRPEKLERPRWIWQYTK